MSAAVTPFNPGSGLRPPELVGRDRQLETVDALIERTAAGMSGRGIVLSGLRGVGKTVLLNEIRDRAEAANWLTVVLEARPDTAGKVNARALLAREFSTAARTLSRRSKATTVTEKVAAALRTVQSFSVKAGVTGFELGVQLGPGDRAATGDLETDLVEVVEDLSAALIEQGTALLLGIDEMQDLDTALLMALLVTQHRAGQRNWPFYIVGAGLPHLPGDLAEVRSYAERLFDYQTVGQVTEQQAREALNRPTSKQHVTFAPDALDLLVDAAGGYPYFLQEYGRAAWDTAPGPDTITRDDARLAIDSGLQRLDEGFFNSRWSRATRSERRLLVAMAIDEGEPSSSTEIARRMKLKPTSLGPYRASLISKGLVYAPQHGQLAYTVPGMDAFVHRHREDTI